MPDDLDDLLRAAMKTLDDEVPSGYFEALPNQTLARLEVSMQHGTSGTTDKELATQVPPVETREEDSGLHDIRSLAQSTKQRISSKRITTSPPENEDDILASSSAGWKAVALPQPAKMVSLPEIDELPSKADIKAAQKAAHKAAKVVKAEGSVVEAKPAPVAAVETAAPARSAFSLPSQHKKSKGPLIAVVGVGLAAAAGLVIFMQTSKSSSDKASAAMTQSTPTSTAALAPKAEPAPAPAAVAQPTATPIETGSAAEAAPADKAAADKAEAVVTEPPKDTVETKNVAKGKKAATKVEKVAPKKDETKAPPVDKKTQKTQKSSDAAQPETKKNADGSEPDFNDLLKEAGVDQNKHEAKPKLEKKMLSGDDFKQGMSAVAAKAQGCYKGTQGMASVKLTIAPSGKVSKVTVGGAFAGKPEAECVASAVKGATFPAWDGGPQSFNYTYLLSE